MIITMSDYDFVATRLCLCILYSQLVLSLTKYLAVLWLLYVGYVRACVSAIEGRSRKISVQSMIDETRGKRLKASG